MSSDLVVLVVPTGPLQAVVSHLADWSSLGVVSEFLVVIEGSSLGADTRARLVGASGSTSVHLGSVVAERQPRTIRVIRLTSGLSEVGSPDFGPAVSLAQHLSGAGGSARYVLANVILTRSSNLASPLQVIEGWHNVLISPEDSQGPGAPRVSLPAYTTPDDLARWAAPTVAALSGLYAGLAESPLDSPVPPGRLIRVARSYFSALDTGRLEDELSAYVIDFERGFPLPQQGARGSEFIPNELRASSDMADALWSKHAGVLKGPREQVRPVAQKGIGALTALRWMFGFLWSALRRAPMEWLRGKVADTKAHLAGQVNSFVFGSDSDYRAEIRGMSQRYSSVWAGQLEDLRGWEAQLQRLGTEQEVHADFSPVWHDLVDGALTLCDGGERSPELPPISVGANVGVLQYPRSCAGAPRDRFTDVTGAVRSAVSTSTVEASDYLTAVEVLTQLNALQDDPTLALEATKTGERLRTWMSDREQSFTMQCSKRLATAFLERRDEIRQLGSHLHQLSSPVSTGASERSTQERLARRLNILLAVMVVLLVLLVTGGVLGLIGWTLVSIVGAVVLLGWLGGSFMIFFQGQRALFQSINQRTKAISEAAVAEHNLIQAIRDARRIGDCYTLMMSWMRVLGAFIADPVAAQNEHHEVTRQATGKLPLAVRMGEAETTPMALASVGHRMRTASFRPGWLTASWNACLSGSLSALGARAVSLGGDPEGLYHQRRVAGDDVLGEVVGLLEKDGVPAGAGASLWGGLVSAAGGEDGVLGELVASVRVGSRSQTLAEFRRSEASSAGVDGHLAADVFSPRALLGEAHRVESPSWSRSARRGLGRVMVLVETSPGSPPDDFVRPQLEVYPSRAPAVGAGVPTPAAEEIF